MDLRQMEYFVALAEERQFTRAAELTMVSQSGLSSSIRSLEAELGTALFHRTTRRVDLTPAGAALLPHARAMLAQAGAGRDAVVATLGELEGVLRIGSEQCLGVIDVPTVLERFRRRHPRVEIVFEQDGSRTLVERVRGGELDAAFVAGAEGSSAGLGFGGLDHRPLGIEPLVLLSPADHPVAAQRRLALAEVAGEEFVDFRTDWAARGLTDEAFQRLGVARIVAFTVNDVHTLLDLVQRGLGLALVPRPIALKQAAAGLAAIPVSDALPQWSVSAVVPTLEKLGGPARKLVELLSAAEDEPLPAAV